MTRIVLALGGNALGHNCREQRQVVRKTAVAIVDLVAEGFEIILSHGNGPQVGMISLAFEESHKPMPFPECGAMSQGYIGYHLQNAIQNELRNRKIEKKVASLITQVVVKEDDPAFSNPTKPIGAFYSEEEAGELARKNPAYCYKEDAGRGYRRVVSSPKPCDIIEKDIIRDLFAKGHLLIASGGGGIPVVEKEDGFFGVDAVIDKDFVSALLADIVDADSLVILTAVEKVAINFGKENEEWLNQVSVPEMEKHIKAGMFAPGSMLPKVEAALNFIKGKKGRTALITSLERAKEGLAGETGTLITG